MTWFQSSANEDESAKEHVSMFIAVALDFPSGIVRFWTGIGEITFGGYTYLGVGQLGSIAPADEHVRNVAEKRSFSLSGVDPSLVSEADIDACYGRSVTEYFGFIDANGVLVATPETNWEGRIDGITRRDGAEPVIEVSAESKFAVLDQPDGWRFTDEHQQQFFSGDTGLILMPSVMTATVVWGAQNIRPGTGTYPRGIGTPVNKL